MKTYTATVDNAGANVLCEMVSLPTDHGRIMAISCGPIEHDEAFARALRIADKDKRVVATDWFVTIEVDDNDMERRGVVYLNGKRAGQVDYTDPEPVAFGPVIEQFGLVEQ